MFNWNNFTPSLNANYSPATSEQNLKTTFHLNFYTRVFFIIVMILSTIGNLFVIVAILKHERLRSLKGNRLLCSLAVADFLQGAVSVPMRIVESYLISCRISIPFSILFGGISNITILAISIERFLSVYFPFMYDHYMTSRAIDVIISYCWLSVGILSIMSASPWCWVERPLLQNEICSFPVFLRREFIWTLYIYVHLIPLTSVLLLYGFILKASCAQHRRIYQQKVSVWVNNSGRKGSFSPGVAQNSSFGEYLKMFKSVRIVSAVAGLFIILVSPIIIIDVIDILQEQKPSQVIVNIAVCMIYTNNCVNVFVYAGLNKDFRIAFKRIFVRIIDIFTNLKNALLFK